MYTNFMTANIIFSEEFNATRANDKKSSTDIFLLREVIEEFPKDVAQHQEINVNYDML